MDATIAEETGEIIIPVCGLSFFLSSAVDVETTEWVMAVDA